MKKLFVAFILLSFWHFSYSQKRIANEDFSAFNVNISFSQGFIEKLEPLRSYVEGYFFEGQGNDRMKALIVHNSFVSFKYLTEEKLSIAVLPPDVMGKKVKYDEYGYPQALVTKAMDLQPSKFFFKLSVNYESMALKNYYFVDSLLNPGQDVQDIEDKYLIPRVSITWDIYDKYGQVPIYSFSSNAVAKKPIPIEKCLMNGYLPDRYTGNIKCTQETLYEILELAINDLIVEVLAEL